MKEKLRLAVFGHKRWSREGGVEIVVKELCTRMAQQGWQMTCYNRSGHHVSGAEYDDAGKTEYEGIRQKSVPTIERRGLAAVSSSFLRLFTKTPVALHISKRVLTLPLYADLALEDVDRICDIILSCKY